MNPPRLGFAYLPSQASEQLRTVARATEASGLDELWVWEDCFSHSGIASAAAALAWTERVTVGIGLLPVPLRNVAVTAMEIAQLERMFPGRLVAGVGHGVQEWMGQVGVRADSPMTLLREYAVALRQLLGGERVTSAGRYVQLTDVELQWPPDRPPPLMLGGAGPKSVAMAAELGDGNLLTNSLSPADVAGIRTMMTEAGAPPDRPMVSTLVVATGPDADARLARELPLWGAAPGTGVGVAGDAATVADAVRALAAAGATTVVFQSCADQPELESFLGFLGDEVAGLVRSGDEVAGLVRSGDEDAGVARDQSGR